MDLGLHSSSAVSVACLLGLLKLTGKKRRRGMSWWSSYLGGRVGGFDGGGRGGGRSCGD